MEVIRTLVQKYDDLMERRDRRSDKYFLMQSPIPTVLITVGYLAFVYYGPKYMKNREPMKLTNVIIIYNLALSIISGYLFYEGLMSGWWGDYTLGCVPVDYSYNPKPLRMVRTLWMGFMTKIVELLDTVFFILRKKNNQVTFLHVFHHGCIPINCWYALKFVAGGMGTFGCMLNTFVHCVMYFYYFLSAFGDRFRKYLFWKKYLTAMQIIQFLLMIAHGSQFAFVECDFPMFWGYWALCYVLLILGLFINFYIQEYIVRKRKNAAEARQKAKDEKQIREKEAKLAKEE